MAQTRSADNATVARARSVTARATAAPFRTWLPAGCGLAAIGIGVFAVGGIGDGIWPTIFGVESSLDALLSPTHLLLLVGMAAVLTAPLRAAWHEPTQHRGWTELLAFPPPTPADPELDEAALQ